MCMRDVCVCMGGCLYLYIDIELASQMSLLRLVQSEGFLAKLSRIQSSAGNLYTRRCSSFQLVPGLVVSYPGYATGAEQSSSFITNAKRERNSCYVNAVGLG